MKLSFKWQKVISSKETDISAIITTLEMEKDKGFTRICVNRSYGSGASS